MQGIEVPIMKAKSAGQLPDSLDRVEIRAVGWEEVQAEVSLVALAPVAMQQAMVVLGIVKDDGRRAVSPEGNTPQLTEESEEGLGVEALVLASVHQLAIAQPHSSKVSNALSRRMVQQHRVGNLGRHPHTAPRAVLLKVDFVESPKIHARLLHEVLEFFLCSA